MPGNHSNPHSSISHLSVHLGTDQQKPKKAHTQLYWPERTFWCHHCKTGASIYLAASSHTPEGAWQCHTDLCLTALLILPNMEKFGSDSCSSHKCAVFSYISEGKKLWLACLSPFPFFPRKLPSWSDAILQHHASIYWWVTVLRCRLETPTPVHAAWASRRIWNVRQVLPTSLHSLNT